MNFNTMVSSYQLLVINTAVFVAGACRQSPVVVAIVVTVIVIAVADIVFVNVIQFVVVVVVVTTIFPVVAVTGECHPSLSLLSLLSPAACRLRCCHRCRYCYCC